MNSWKILNIVSMVLSGVLLIGGVTKTTLNGMLYDNPIVPDNMIQVILLQDLAKVIAIICICLVQFKLYKKEKYINSAFLTLLAFFVYHLKYIWI